jgi:hypothetical protein
MVYTFAQTVMIIHLAFNTHKMQTPHLCRLHTHERLLWQIFYLCAAYIMLQYITALALILVNLYLI